MHKFSPEESGEVMGTDEAQKFWNLAEQIVGMWKSTKPGPATEHMAEVLQQLSENMREADKTRDGGVADFVRCNHGVPIHRHVKILGSLWCPSHKRNCDLGGLTTQEALEEMKRRL